jgi:hypothetical protein
MAVMIQPRNLSPKMVQRAKLHALSALKIVMDEHLILDGDAE